MKHIDALKPRGISRRKYVRNQALGDPLTIGPLASASDATVREPRPAASLLRGRGFVCLPHFGQFEGNVNDLAAMT
jgi:hypothetical protein